MKNLAISLETDHGRMTFEGLLTLSHYKGDGWCVNGIPLQEEGFDENQFRERIEAHNNACLANPPETFRQWMERDLDRKEEPADPFAEWPVKPDMWVESEVYGPLKLYAVGSGLSHDKAEGFVINKSQAELNFSNCHWRILTPAEVEAHERKLKYPVLAPGDRIEWRSGLCQKAVEADNGWIHFGSGVFFTQEECRAKLESGEWIKYVREVKP